MAIRHEREVEATVSRLDGYLTKKVQDAFGPSAQVLVFSHPNLKEDRWVLRRGEDGRGDVRLGGTFKLAREAVQALVRAEFRKRREKGGAR